jgi:hypothetical protein
MFLLSRPADTDELQRPNPGQLRVRLLLGLRCEPRPYFPAGLAGYQPRGLAKSLGGFEHLRDDSYGSAGRIRRVSCNEVTPLTRLGVPPEQNEVLYSPVERRSRMMRHWYLLTCIVVFAVSLLFAWRKLTKGPR